MRNLVILTAAVLLMTIAGCAENELQNCKLNVISLKGDMDEVQAQLTASQAELNTQKTAYEDKIAKMAEDNKQMQEKALESITKMLNKQIEADKKVQESLQAQINSLTQENADLKAKLTPAPTPAPTTQQPPQ